MKKVTYFFSMAIMLIALSGYNSASAQGRGHKNGHDKNRNDRRDHDNRDRDRNNGKDWNKGGDKKWSYGDNDHRDRHHNHGDRNWERRRVVHHYHTHDRHCNHRPVVVHHYVKPRYIYYRDYDVYYDCNRSVYISYSGGSWTVSAGLPLFMRQVDIRRASRWEVDYWDDNLPVYLRGKRPNCGREYFGG